VTHFLNQLATALGAFGRLDPAGWFAWRGMLRPSGAYAAIALGLFCLGIGAKEGVFRFVAVPLGGLLGVALCPPILSMLHGTPVPAQAVALGVPAALALLSGFFPQTIAFVSLGAVGAAVARMFASDSELLITAVPAFLVVGVLGIIFARVFDTLAASVCGALLAVGGLMAAFPTGPVHAVLAASVYGPVIAAALLAAGGAALQLVLYGNPEEIAARKAAAADAKARAKEDKARDKKLAAYGKKKG